MASEQPEEKKAYSDLDQKNLEDEKKRTVALEEWLRENKCSFPHLYFEYYAVDFRGVAINTDLARNEIILKVDPSCLLTIEKAKESEIGQRIISSGCRVRSSHSYVASFLLQERKKGEASFWHPYIDILPKSYSHMPILLSDEELKLLTGSIVLDQVQSRKDSYRREYNEICRYLPEFGEAYSWRDFFWARLVVLTRIFGITIHGKKTSSMVPMADMLNHKRPPETYWTFDDSFNAFTITTSKEFKTGEQVYDSYGRKCNTEFYLNYGFVAAANMFNTAKIILSLTERDPLFSRKYQLMGRGRRDFLQLEIPTNYEKDIVVEAFSYARLAAATESEFFQLSGGDTYNPANVKKIRPLNLRNELAALKLLQTGATEGLALFETTYEEDVKFLEEGKGLHMNTKNCVNVRMCEKEVLKYYQDLITIVTPLFAPEMTPDEATAAVAECKAINDHKHLRHYVHTVLLPLLAGQHATIGELVDSFASMTLAQAKTNFRRVESDSDYDY